MSKNTTEDLEKMLKGLKKTIKKARKLDPTTKINLGAYTECAMGKIWGCNGSFDFNRMSQNLFGFQLSSSYRPNMKGVLGDTKASITKLFGSRGLGEAENRMTIALWVFEAEQVKEKLENKIKKRKETNMTRLTNPYL